MLMDQQHRLHLHMEVAQLRWLMHACMQLQVQRIAHEQA